MSSPLLATRGLVHRPVHRPAHRALVAVLAGLLVLLVAPPLAQAETAVEVRITSRLDPASVTVVPGTTVTWVNADGERHRMRSEGPEEFDSGNLEPRERFSHTFRTVGTTSYVDDRNEDDAAYHGTVVVAAEESPEQDSGTSGTSGTSGSSDASGPRSYAVSMADRRFSPATLEITTGDTVRFVNDDDREHTATADGRSFDSGILQVGQEFERTFTEAGTYSYLCLLHPDMTGTIAVADAGGTAPPPEPAPEPTPRSGSPSPSSQPTGGDAPAVQRATVQMRDFSFAPATVEVTAGSTVVFDNAGQALHTATATDGSFDSDLVSPGASFERRFDEPGTFPYTCLLHPEMVGEVVVTAAAGGAASASGASSASATSNGSSSTDGGTATGTPPPGTVDVSLEDFAFSPSDVRIRAGDTVRFRNDGQALHTATARDGSHDSGLLRPGAVAERTFDAPGTFAYWCTLHPDMVATIRVAAADGTVPAPGPTDGSGDDADPRDAVAANRDGGGADPSVPAAVSVVDDAFLPDVLEVAVGQEVVWTNDGEAVHTVTADEGSFDSGLVAAGESFRMRFEEPGTVAYLCSVHPGMTAEVRVLALADGAAALDPDTAAAAAGDGGLSLVTLEVLMLGAFAVALAGFTALSRRIGAMDAGADA